MDSSKPSQHLSFLNVLLAFSFILLNVFVSGNFGLGIGISLLSAAVRCVVQLALVALILQKVFETDSPWFVGGIVRTSHFGLDDYRWSLTL